jgi:mannitol-specific phosphotransferase system IIBC component
MMFEKLLRDSSIIISSFVMKSTRSDTNDSKVSFENEKKKNEKKRDEKTNTNAQDVNIKKNDY